MRTHYAVIWLITFVGTVFFASACSDVPFLGGDKCGDPTSPFAAEYYCANIDAGTDAESDAKTDASNLRDPEDPGLQPSAIFPEDACKTECVPEAAGPLAAGWSDRPLVVWFGPSSELAAHNCPDGVSYEKVRGFDKLVAPPAKCDACACLADGACTGLPETIEIRSGKCGVSNVQTTPFDGPVNWDGSCTSVNAMAAGKICNGVPCAQSVSASTLPAPTNESCTPKVEKPIATLDKHEWLEGVLACGAKDLDGKCGVTPEHCVGPLDDGWLRCVSHPGKLDACPNNYTDLGPYWVYQDNPIDDRGCSDCACGAPKGGICKASLRLYSDSSCATELNSNQLASTNPFCVDLSPPGLALGSKTIVNLPYVPGSCAVTGGEPIGTVIPNDDENSVTTICCRDPAPPPPPKPPG